MPYRKPAGWGRYQPPEGSQVDWSNPITRDLTSRFLLNEKSASRRYDIAKYTVAGSQTDYLDTRNSPLGKSLNFSNNSGPGSWLRWAYTRAQPQSLPLTFLGWAYNATSTANLRVLCIADEASDNEWMLLYIDNTTGVAGATSTTGAVQASATGTTDCRDKWHQVAAVFESTTSRKVYVDGHLEGTNTTSNSPNFSTFDSLGTGALHRLSILYGSGLVTNLSVWKRALSASEIRWLFDNPFGDIRKPRRRISKTGIPAPSGNGRMFLTF